jgi:Ser/Thr protein kinase RdoA (MazF antagonist)
MRLSPSSPRTEIPVVAPLVLAGTTLHTSEPFRFAVYPRCGGRAPELDRRETLEWMGRFLGRIHAVGAASPFRQRPTLDVRTFGTEPRDFLLAHDFIPPDLVAAWQSIAAQALAAVQRCYERAGELTPIRLHGDCHAGNVLWIEHGDTRGPHFVDFDDARLGPAVQDLWMLLSGDRAEMTLQLSYVLAGYDDFFAFDRASSIWWRPCARCAFSTIRHGSHNGGTILRSRWRFRGSTRRGTGRIASSNCASRLR